MDELDMRTCLLTAEGVIKLPIYIIPSSLHLQYNSLGFNVLICSSLKTYVGIFLLDWDKPQLYPHAANWACQLDSTGLVIYQWLVSDGEEKDNLR